MVVVTGRGCSECRATHGTSDAACESTSERCEHLHTRISRNKSAKWAGQQHIEEVCIRSGRGSKETIVANDDVFFAITQKRAKGREQQTCQSRRTPQTGTGCRYGCLLER